MSSFFPSLRREEITEEICRLSPVSVIKLLDVEKLGYFNRNSMEVYFYCWKDDANIIEKIYASYLQYNTERNDLILSRQVLKEPSIFDVLKEKELKSIPRVNTMEISPPVYIPTFSEES